MGGGWVEGGHKEAPLHIPPSVWQEVDKQKEIMSLF